MVPPEPIAMTGTKPMLAMIITAGGTALTFAEGLLISLRIGGAAITLAIGVVTIIQLLRRR